MILAFCCSNSASVNAPESRGFASLSSAASESPPEVPPPEGAGAGVKPAPPEAGRTCPRSGAC
jgi:hypothetical protein